MDMEEFPSNVIAGQLFQCSVDYCLNGIQFCNIKEGRCEYCNAHHHSCFTNVQEANCTEYCMDQWKQNWKLENTEREAETDLYKTLFFILFGIIVSSFLALIIICACKPRFCRHVLSSIRCLKNSAPNCNQATGLSCGKSVTDSTLSTSVNVEPILIPGAHASPNVNRNIPPNIERQDADGVSRHEHVQRDGRGHRSENRVPQQRAQAPSPNTTRKEPVQYFTKANNSKQIYNFGNGPDREALPLMKRVSKELIDESITIAKRPNDDINRQLGNELSTVHSNGYMALPPFSRSGDTGYDTGATG